MADLNALLKDRRRLKNIAVLAFVVVLVNLPLLLSTWTNHRVESAGTDVTASVTAIHNLGTDAEPRWWVSFRFPVDVDPGQGTWAAHVDQDAKAAAEESGTIGVRVLEDDPAAHTVSGEVRSRAGLWTTLAVDALLLLLIGLLWRYRGRGAPTVEVVEGLTDVSPAPPRQAWEDLGDGTATITGEVVDADEDSVTLRVGRERVRVVLDGRANPVARQDFASVRVRLPAV